MGLEHKRRSEPLTNRMEKKFKILGGRGLFGVPTFFPSSSILGANFFDCLSRALVNVFEAVHLRFKLVFHCFS